MEAKGGVCLAQVSGVVGEVEIGDNLEGGLAELVDTAPKGEGALGLGGIHDHGIELAGVKGQQVRAGGAWQVGCNFFV